MGLLNRIFGNKTPTTGFKLITERGNGFFVWNGRLFESDIIRSCIRPTSKAVGKLTPVHIRKDKEGKIIKNPEPYIKALLIEPNPLMTFQVYNEKMTNQLELNNNAFALIVRGEGGYPLQLWPIVCSGAEAKFEKDGTLKIKFFLLNGKMEEYPYTDIIHLRQDFNENDVFGTSPATAITSLMTIVTSEDQSMIASAKNSNVLRWLLKFKNILKKEAMDEAVKNFNDSYLSIDSKFGGAAGVNANYEIEPVKGESYSPKGSQLERTVTRAYNFFHTNEDIIQGKFDEDGWMAWYETKIEDKAMQMTGEYTRKLLPRNEWMNGDMIIFESMNLQYASMSTKLALKDMVDRGSMTPNEWRTTMNMGPIDNGDKPMRRKDTGLVEEDKNT